MDQLINNLAFLHLSWWQLFHALQHHISFVVHDHIKELDVVWVDSPLVGVQERRLEVAKIFVDLQNVLFCVSGGFGWASAHRRGLLFHQIWQSHLRRRWLSRFGLLFCSLRFTDLLLIFHPHGCLDDLWRCLNRHVSIFDFIVILVSHFSEIRIDVIKTLFVFLEDEIVVILIHLANLSLLVQLLLNRINWSLV